MNDYSNKFNKSPLINFGIKVAKIFKNRLIRG